MTPKEYATELVNKFSSEECYLGRYAEDYSPKQCALICADEIIGCLVSVAIMPPCAHKEYLEVAKFYEQVKEEIEKL